MMINSYLSSAVAVRALVGGAMTTSDKRGNPREEVTLESFDLSSL